MLSKQEFEQWCDRLSINSKSQQIIENIRSSEPSRRVGGGKRNVSGRYPSKKMGLTIQFESHKVELPFVYQLEYDDDVLEYYDQPPPLKLNYLSKSGKKGGFFYTPDYFVIRENSAEWWECKTEEHLHKLAEKKPERYFLGDDNEWHYSSAEEYATELGLTFRVWSSASIDWTLQQNLEFLEDYFRYDD